MPEFIDTEDEGELNERELEELEQKRLAEELGEDAEEEIDSRTELNEEENNLDEEE